MVPRWCEVVAMRVHRSALARGCSGQSLLETVLVMPLMLLIVLNVVNLGYFFVVAVNLAAAPRSGVQYSTVSYLSYQDLTGAINAPTTASLQVCSQVLGLNGAGANLKTLCVTCSGSTCGNSNIGSPVPAADPEAPGFVLNRVDVDYTFSPLIPGTPFGLALLPISTCSAGGGNVTCTFHRQVSMRVME